MTKEELSELLHSCCKRVNEGVVSEKNQNQLPNVCYWDFSWTDEIASGNDYTTVVTYQISILARRPRSAELMAVRKALIDKGLHPAWQHEYVETTGIWHSYCAVDVTEDLNV